MAICSPHHVRSLARELRSAFVCLVVERDRLLVSAEPGVQIPQARQFWDLQRNPGWLTL